MPDLYIIAIALFSCFGFISIIWAIAGRCMTPRGENSFFVTANVRTADELHSFIRHLEWLRLWGGNVSHCLILSDNLDNEALKMAEFYCERQSNSVFLCNSAELAALITSQSNTIQKPVSEI